MRPGREIDTKIAQNIFGYNVKVKQRELWEDAPLGERPLRKYSKEISAAWEVVEKMAMTLIPVDDDKWFAFVGHGERWKGPAEFIKYLQTSNFEHSGAAVGEELPLTVCIAALKAIENREVASATPIEKNETYN
jgi:hypothetical protein